MTDDQLIALLSRADLYGPDSEMPPSAWDGGRTLAEIERRMGMDPSQRVEDRTDPAQDHGGTHGAPQVVRKTQHQRRSRRGPLIAAALAVVALVAGVGSWLVSTDMEDVAATGSGFVEAFNDGDTEALFALLAPEATISLKYTGMSVDFEPMERAAFDRYVTWELAQGSELRAPECVLTVEQEPSVVVCAVEWVAADAQAVEGHFSPSTLTMTVVNGRITDLMVEQTPNFGLAGFNTWVEDNHPESAELIEFRDWTSIDDARAGGERRAELASEWKSFLDANGCTFDPRIDRVDCP